MGVLVLVGLSLPTTASANQPQDWYIGARKEDGDQKAILDLFVGGFQAQYEYHDRIYGAANSLSLRGGSIIALPFGLAQAEAELRLVNLFLGVKVGALDVWREMTFAPGEDFSRKSRRRREFAGDFDNRVRPFIETRAMLALPFNDYSVLTGEISYRQDRARNRTFDWLNNVVRDDDLMKLEVMLFGKHGGFGALAPVFQVLRYDVGGKTRQQANVGFLFLTRAGLVRRDDILVWRMYFHLPGVTGGYDNSDSYGWATLRGPLTFQLVYRSVIDL